MTVPDIARTEPDPGAGERDLLDGWLDYYRATVVHKCAGLSPEQLAERSCTPSTMSLLGLVRHMIEMERVYAHRLAEPDLPFVYVTDASPDGDFDDASAATATTDLASFVATCGRSREVFGPLALDDKLRWRYLYLIKEYARHLGHADLLRERIDGATGE